MQVLHADSSCREAVALVLGGQAAAGPAPECSADPSAYGQARRRLPLEVFRAGVRQIGRRLRQEVGSSITWCGRRVWLVDGTSCSMPDTPDLQAAFGQPGRQAPGCGFPVAKVVALFCWASGAVLEAAIGPLKMSELRLWRELWPVRLADRPRQPLGALGNHHPVHVIGHQTPRPHRDAPRGASLLQEG